MAQHCSQEERPKTGDGHESPCAWSKAIMWAAIILVGLGGLTLSVGAYALGSVNSRVAVMEQQAGNSREALAGLKASMDYVVRDVSDIKATLRKATGP